MARLKRVVARLQEWAAWVECGAKIPRCAITGIPKGQPMTDSWIRDKQRELRRTQKVVQQLPTEHQAVIVLVYLIGPRANETSINGIAEWCGMSKSTLYYRIERAEGLVADALDGLSQDDDAMD